jgi:HK97 family phage major capsid protein
MKRRSLQLKDKRNELVKAAEAILDAVTDDKPMTAEQRKLLDKMTADIKTLNLDIEAAELIEETRREPTQDVTAIVKPSTSTPADKEEHPRVTVPWARRTRHSTLKAFRGEHAEEHAYASGMWILATLFNRQDAQEFCVKNGIPMIKNAALEGANTQGGFLVPEVLERTIIDLREEFGVLRQLARIYPMASDYQTIPRRAGGLTAVAIGEGQDITDSSKAWNNVALTARKWAVLAKYSSEIAEDAIISIAEDLAQEISYAFAVAEDAAGFIGDGSAAYHGITGVVTKFNNQVVAGASTFAGALDAASTHDQFFEIDAVDLAGLTAKLPKYALNRAGWICSQPCWSLVFQRLQAAAGGNSVMDLAGKMQYSFLGYPVIISQQMPTTTGDLSDKVMLLFGDFASAVCMGTRRGISLAVSDQRYFESDQLAIRGTERFDINVHDIGDTVTAGPLVALIGE